MAGIDVHRMLHVATVLANFIAGVASASGQAILRAIVAGKRSPYVLARLKNRR